MADSIVTKVCFLCRLPKPISEFYKKSDKRDGLASRCIKCFHEPRPSLRLHDKRFVDLSGQRFGQLVVISVWEKLIGTGFMWACLCDCGKTTTVQSGNLIGSRQISCGCVKDRKSAERQYRHGRCGTREYESWMHAKGRCFNPDNAAYADYGGRGITMCEDWCNSFESFLTYMGECPRGMTIDRINNNGNYEPGNCRWATRKVQNRNRRDTVMVTHNGETKSLRDWADVFNIPFDALRHRYENGVIPLFARTFRLSDVQRAEIRTLYASKSATTRELASQFGVGRQTIYNVING